MSKKVKYEVLPNHPKSENGDLLTVKVELPKRTGKVRRQRVYTETVLEMLKELAPKEVVLETVKTAQVRHDDLMSGEWVFRVLKERKVVVPKKKVVKKVAKTETSSSRKSSSKED